MTIGKLEHVNVTVSDPDKTAQMLEAVFGWKVRWSGPSKDNGYTVHVGGEEDYLAIYRHPAEMADADDPGRRIGGLNHLGVVVDDLDATEARVKEAGFRPFNHADYDPGRRFYFYDRDEIEYEVVSYAS